MDKFAITQNIDRIHTTPMGADRIRRNINLQDEDPVLWCKNAVEHADLINRKGKNWYINFKGVVITINASSYTIITAHKTK